MRRLLTASALLTALAGSVSAQQPVRASVDTMPAAIVQRFVDAANARDAGAMAALVAPQAVFARLPDGQILAQGRDGIQAFYARLLPALSPGFRITVQPRIVEGSLVVDQEHFTGTKDEQGQATWMYQVQGGLIHRAWDLDGQPRTAPSPRFNHVMLFVADLDSSIAFYTAALELRVAQRITELTVTGANGAPSARPVKMALLKFPGRDFVLELAERPAPASAGAAPHYQHLGVDVRDIAAAAERVRKAGGQAPSPIQTVSTSSGTIAKNMFFRGPSGELVELMEIVSGEF
jgi:uncharacterized protein (TIGR02246 family)